MDNVILTEGNNEEDTKEAGGDSESNQPANILLRKVGK